MAGGLILNWILGVILFFALWAIIMSAIRKLSQRYQRRKEVEEAENEGVKEEVTIGVKEGVKEEVTIGVKEEVKEGVTIEVKEEDVDNNA